MVGVGDDRETELDTTRLHHRRQRRLRDHTDCCGVRREVAEFGRGGPGVGGDGNRTEMRTCEPGDEELRTVAEVDQHTLARLHPTCGESGGEGRDFGAEFGIGPTVTRVG